MNEDDWEDSLIDDIVLMLIEGYKTQKDLRVLAEEILNHIEDCQ